MKAKQFLENKQQEYFDKFGVNADTNSKIAEWMDEYVALVLLIAAEKVRIIESKNFGYSIIDKESITNCLKE